MVNTEGETLFSLVFGIMDCEKRNRQDVDRNYRGFVYEKGWWIPDRVNAVELPRRRQD